MANTKSAIKHITLDEKRRVRNAAVKSETRTQVKKARTAITRAIDEAPAALKDAMSALDVAARKGVIHPNNAARRKSRLMKAYNASVAVAAAPAEPVAAEEAPKKRATRTRKTAK